MVRCFVVALTAVLLLTSALRPLADASGFQIQQPRPFAATGDEARVLANKHFGKPTTAGCFVEERNTCWFVAPPYLDPVATERAGVYVVKETGRVLPYYPVDAPLFEGRLPAGGISKEQAQALVEQFRGTKPAACYPADDLHSESPRISGEARGNYWIFTPIVIKTSVHYYVDRYTGRVTREMPAELAPAEKKKKR